MKDYDVIVIGSGINSLSAAALLSKARKKVLVLEAREKIGGMASTVEFFPHSLIKPYLAMHPLVVYLLNAGY